MLFDPDTGETRAMRTKEDAADYRYFPDPDLPPLAIAPDWVERVRARDARAAARDGRALSCASYGLPEYDADAADAEQGAWPRYFEAAAAASGQRQAGQQLDHGRDRRAA